MNLEEKKILAMTECLLLWDQMSKHGHLRKEFALEDLHGDELLAQYTYEAECPFCEYLRRGDDMVDSDCEDCLWPAQADGKTCQRCLSFESPFSRWLHNKTKADAQKVLNMLLKIDF